MNDNQIEKILDSSLKTEPDFFLNLDFAEKVTRAVVKQEQWKTDLYEYLYLIGLLLAIASVFLGLYYFIDKAMLSRILLYVSDNLMPIVLIGSILNFILFVDRVLLRLLFNRWKLN